MASEGGCVIRIVQSTHTISTTSLLGSCSSSSSSGVGTQNFVDPKWSSQIFPIANFVFSHSGHYRLGRGEGGFSGGAPPPWFSINYLIIIFFGFLASGLSLAFQ